MKENTSSRPGQADNGSELQSADTTRLPILMFEGDILKGLLEAEQYRWNEENSVNIQVERRGKLLFSFRIRPLGEEEYQKCKEKCTKYVRNNQYAGIKIPESTDSVRYRSLLIYTATVDEDRKAIWDNTEAWRQINVLNGPDLIDKVLLAGEKDAILDKLDEISGYTSTLEEVAKN